MTKPLPSKCEKCERTSEIVDMKDCPFCPQSEVKPHVGMLRQWLNEKPADRLVTNEDILYWLKVAEPKESPVIQSVEGWEKEWNYAESEQCVRANIDRPSSAGTPIANIMAHFGTKIRSLRTSTLSALVKKMEGKIRNGANMNRSIENRDVYFFNQGISAAVEVVNRMGGNNRA